MDANTTRLSLSELQKKGYFPGSILRCRMRNFLTYDDVEVFPGPKLNVLLGPNGTGKSAITHAICLACGGAPSTLGRSNDLTEFVKHGKEHENISFVEVDLFNPSDEHYIGVDRTKFVATIRRIINHETKGSKYTFNRRPSTQREVKALMRKLKIDVDNLCSFMPQDRVGEFAKYSPSELLQNTLKTISCSSSLVLGSGTDSNGHLDEDGLNDTNLYEVQLKLASEESTKRNLDTEKHNREMEVTKYKKKLEELQPDIKREEKRQSLQQLVELYQVKKGLLKVEEAKAKRAAAQKGVEIAEQALHDNQMLLEPLIKREREAKVQFALADKRLAECSKKCSSTGTKLVSSRENVIKCESNLGVIRQEIESINQRALRMEDDLKKQREEESRLQASYVQTLNTVENANIPQRMQDLITQSKTYNNACEKTRDDIHALNQKKVDLHQHLERGKKQLSKFQDPRRMFLNRLNVCKESYKTKQAVNAMQFLIQNEERLRHEGKLRGAVYGPIAYYCNVENPVCAAMLENSVSTYKWMNFVVTCNEDKRMLKNEFGKLNLRKIDVAVVADTKELENRMNACRNELNNMDVYESLGVQGLLVDAIDCPDPIKMFLLTHGGLSNVYWSTNVENNRINDRYLYKNMDERHLKSLLGNKKLVRIYIYNRLGDSSKIIHYSVSKSRFGSDYTSYNDNIDVAASFLMQADQHGNDDGDRNELIETLREYESSINELEHAIKAKNKEVNQFQADISQLKDEMSKLNTLKHQPDRVKIQLSTCKNKIRDIESKINGAYGERERLEKTKEYESGVRNLLELMSLSIDLGEVSMKQSIDRLVHEKIKMEMNSIHENISGQLNEARGHMDELRERVNEAIENRKSAVRELEMHASSMQQVEEALEQEGPGNYDRLIELVLSECGPLVAPEVPVELFNALQRKIPDTYTLNDVEIQIDNVTNEIQSCIENPLILQQYNETKELLKFALEDLERITKEFTDVNISLCNRMDDWKNSVKDVVCKLDILFSDYMDRLGYSGNVVFEAVGRISEYEISMKVSYRENEKAVKLTSSRQSGGEKSVATIMYLMALQGLTTSPFRVVDEINQGMDERNERLVIDRIVSSCCTSVHENESKSPTRNRALSDEQRDRIQKLKVKPQYFLVSPKLLDALNAINHPDVTVLMVWNGPGVLQNTWQITDIIRNLICYCNKNNIKIPDGILDDSYCIPETTGSSSSLSNSKVKASKKRPMSDITNAKHGMNSMEMQQVKKKATASVDNALACDVTVKSENDETSIKIKNENIQDTVGSSGTVINNSVSNKKTSLYRDCVIDLSQLSDSDTDSDIIIID